MVRFSVLRIAAVIGLVLALPSAALAQAGGVRGTITDADGRPIKGATVKGSNPNGKPPQITATTDDKGRFAMIGLTGGAWTFVAEAPGFTPQQGRANIRSISTGNPAIDLVLTRSLEPLPNALNRQIAADITSADEMRAAGRLDQAIAAYEDILSKNPTLTMINLVIADVYRAKAGKEANPVARQPLYDRAIASYQTLLKTEPDNARAKSELAKTQQAKTGSD